MRLIGNKSKLLGDIEQLLTEQGIHGGTLIDIFSGTSSVGRHFKERGYRVLGNDNMAMCHAQAVAGLEVSRYPRFARFRKRYAKVFESTRFRQALRHQREFFENRKPQARPLLEVVRFLNHSTTPVEGLIFRNFCPGGPAGRGYFQDDNGRKIDAILHCLQENLHRGDLTRGEFYLLLSSLLDAADRVANISGTYGAYLKNWQASACKPLELLPPRVIESRLKHRAYREDANAVVRRLRGDVLYIDPPYNRRQYAANYHVLEIIAEYHTIDDLERYESALYGKTGLRPYDELRSRYCVPPASRRASSAGDVWHAFLDLVTSSKVRHVVVSYNEEGLLTRDEIATIMARFEGKRSFDLERGFRQVVYKRFRSDKDRRPVNDRGGRSYKVIDGRRRDEIGEWLFFASRKPPASRRRLHPAAGNVSERS